MITFDEGVSMINRRFLVLFFWVAILVSPLTSKAVTIIKAVGHGDCYVVISDGRVVVIDAGPGNAAALVSFLKSGYLHYDRIIITHVHSDHVGGLVPAAKYALEAGSAFTTDLLVSNHGEHDLDLVIRESNIPPLLRAMRGQKRVAALTQEALTNLALDDPHLRVEAWSVSADTETQNENRTGLVVKVSEIRDGQSRATLFLGDIEAPQQRALFAHPQASQIFKNVRAVTLPHHGRKTTLLPEFFQKIKDAAGEGTIVLHSDSVPLDAEVKAWADDVAIRILSSAPPRKTAVPTDVHVNLFDEPSYYVVSKQPTTISSLAARRAILPGKSHDISATELATALSNFTDRKTTEILPVGTTISVPTETWVKTYTDSLRQATREENRRLIEQLKAKDEKIVKDAVRTLTLRLPKLRTEDIDQMLAIMRQNGETWSTDMGPPPDCPHKTIYKDRSTQYYVASVLLQKRAALSDQISREVAKAYRDGRETRVESDPGWV
jgi:beta-lactamase superfamily II metal-dependent hydrolase